MEYKQILKNVGYYLILPIGVISATVGIFYSQFEDLEKAVNVSATVLQVLAIFVGGLWAYHKFDWNKRAESAIKMKAMLMDFYNRHCDAAMKYRVDEAEKIDWMDCWTEYSMKMIPAHNDFNSQIQLACYLPKKLRKRIFEVKFLSINKGKSPKEEDLDENWKKLGQEVEKLKEELDNVVSK